MFLCVLFSSGNLTDSTSVQLKSDVSDLTSLPKVKHYAIYLYWKINNIDLFGHVHKRNNLKCSNRLRPCSAFKSTLRWIMTMRAFFHGIYNIDMAHHVGCIPRLTLRLYWLISSMSSMYLVYSFMWVIVFLIQCHPDENIIQTEIFIINDMHKAYALCDRYVCIYLHKCSTLLTTDFITPQIT